jgi:hypothetical protein
MMEERQRAERMERREYRRRHVKGLQVLGNRARLGEASSFGSQVPDSNVRDTGILGRRRRYRDPPARSNSLVDEIPLPLDDPFDTSVVRRVGSEVIPDGLRSERDGKKQVGEGHFSRLMTAAELNSAGADVLVVNSEDEIPAPPAWSRTLAPTASRATHEARRVSQRHRRTTPSYHYIADHREITPLAPEYYMRHDPDDALNKDVRRKRKRIREDGENGDEAEQSEVRREARRTSPADSNETKRRKGKQRAKTELRTFLDRKTLFPAWYQAPEPPNLDPRFQPVSRHGDPAIKDKEYQLAHVGLYVARGKRIDRTGRVWAKNNQSRRERHGALVPQLKMSRTKSADTRAARWVLLRDLAYSDLTTADMSVL